ncbi:hypothetical protein BC829DRAFT_247697 [Chytridium lagenaria]|nr:hypothetical protein BC829DRAFT_247697 [Chytridium lagenaria]
MGDGLLAIFEAMATNTYLEELVLAGQRFGPDCLTFFLDALERNKVLHKIVIRKCGLGAADTAKVLTGIAKAGRFKIVDISTNEFDEQCYLQVVEWIKNDHCLQVFDGWIYSVPSPRMSNETASSLLSAIASSDTLYEFQLDLRHGLTLDVEDRLNRNRWNQATENTTRAWAQALHNDYKGVKIHLRSLKDFAVFLKKNQHYLLLLAWRVWGCGHVDR